MDGDQRMLVRITAIIMAGIVSLIFGVTYLYHWKKVEMAKAGFEEVSVQTSIAYQLAWEKVKP